MSLQWAFRCVLGKFVRDPREGNMIAGTEVDTKSMDALSTETQDSVFPRALARMPIDPFRTVMMGTGSDFSCWTEIYAGRFFLRAVESNRRRTLWQVGLGCRWAFSLEAGSPKIHDGFAL